MLDVTTLARPYARALFEYALEKSALPQWRESLDLLAQIVQEPLVHKLILDPGISGEQLSGVIIALTKGRLSDEGKNFVSLLASNGRLGVMPVISELFEKLRLDHEKTVNVTLTSAVELESSFIEKLKKLLVSKLNRNANVHCELDESLLGGLLIRTGDTVIDGSVKGELNRLKEALMG